MKLLRRLLLLIASVILLVCVVLLLNFTAPNPTGRRYSSAEVKTTGTPDDIGRSGEDVLSKDLRLPRNEDPTQRICVCRNPESPYAASGTRCLSCMTVIESLEHNRLPDFIADGFIADSKNTKELPSADATQVAQITDYSIAALQLKRPLWLYVRIDTQVDPRYTQLAEATGGGVVYYFATPGYVDPVDQLALTGAALSLGVIGLVILLPRLRRRKRPTKPGAPPPPRDKLQRKVADMEAFARQRRERARRSIDEEDARHEPER